jgi:hypothetical protein
MGIPGNVSNNGYSYLYSPQDEGVATYPATTVASIERPTVTAFTNNTTSISVSFTINGNNVHNGYAWFYDSSNTYVGKFLYFLDKTSGAITSRLSGGVFNHADGQSNTLSLSLNDIVDSNNNAITQAVFNWPIQV